MYLCPPKETKWMKAHYDSRLGLELNTELTVSFDDSATNEITIFSTTTYWKPE
jgi:hypothetical protein